MNQDVIHNFKMFYSKKIIKQLVENMDNNESFFINILKTIRMFDKNLEEV